MSRQDVKFENLETLERFWRRRTFHDMLIEEVSALNRRVVIRLDEFTLVVTGSIGLERCEVPCVWLTVSMTRKPAGFLLKIETDTGTLKISGDDVRLLRNCDLAMLIPPLDA